MNPLFDRVRLARAPSSLSIAGALTALVDMYVLDADELRTAVPPGGVAFPLWPLCGERRRVLELEPVRRDVRAAKRANGVGWNTQHRSEL